LGSLSLGLTSMCGEYLLSCEVFANIWRDIRVAGSIYVSCSRRNHTTVLWTVRDCIHPRLLLSHSLIRSLRCRDIGAGVQPRFGAQRTKNVVLCLCTASISASDKHANFIVIPHRASRRMPRDPPASALLASLGLLLNPRGGDRQPKKRPLHKPATTPGRVPSTRNIPVGRAPLVGTSERRTVLLKRASRGRSLLRALHRRLPLLQLLRLQRRRLPRGIRVRRSLASFCCF
jgi:hypothetical protein